MPTRPVQSFSRTSHRPYPARPNSRVLSTTTVRPPHRARDAAAAARLWSEAEHLTGVTLPAGATQP